MSSFLSLDYVTPISITSNTRSFRGKTVNQKVQTVKSDSQQWQMTITLEPTAGREDDPITGELAAHFAEHGDFASFSINMPQHPGVADAISGTFSNVLMRGSTAAGIDEVKVDSTTNVSIPAGLYITIGSDKKVYQVREKLDITSTDTDAVLKIYPALGTATTDNNSMDDTPTIEVYYTEGGQSITYSDGRFTQATLSVEEALT